MRPPIARLFVLSLVLLGALTGTTAGADTCPFNIPVVTIAPQTVGGYQWSPVIRPMGDACVTVITIDPTNDSAWYVGSGTGLYVTKDAGVTWAKPVSGNVDEITIVPGQPRTLYAGVSSTLYVSRDAGVTWSAVTTFEAPIRSLLTTPSTLWIGLCWSHSQPSGAYSLAIGSTNALFHPFGAGQTGLIVWTLAYDVGHAVLYAGTEIYDHPAPYHPPFFRSTDGGATWTNVAGTLPWHVVASAVRPNDGYLYALTEGLGTYGSSTMGASWEPPQLSPGLGDSLLMDPNLPTRLYLGRQSSGLLTGGLYLSTNGGRTAQPIGLDGATVAGIALNGTASRLYASGIYVSPAPAPPKRQRVARH